MVKVTQTLTAVCALLVAPLAFGMPAAELESRSVCNNGAGLCETALTVAPRGFVAEAVSWPERALALRGADVSAHAPRAGVAAPLTNAERLRR